MKLRVVGDNLTFKCPGCKDFHTVRVGEGPGPRWTWNGSTDAPTIRASVLTRSGHYIPGHWPGACWCTYYEQHPEEERDFECGVCHSFVTDGNIEFLNDCTHALKGQTVALPDLEPAPNL